MTRKHGHWSTTQEAEQWATRARRRAELAELRRGRGGYGPTVDRDRPDVLGADDEYEGEDEGEYDDEPGPETAVRSVVRAVLAPEALALASLVIAVVSLLGFGLLNGSPYMPTQFSMEPAPTDRSVLVLTVLLGAALALLPTALGVWALRRLPDDSPSRTTAGAGVLIAGLSFVLRLAIAARTAADDGNPFVQF